LTGFASAFPSTEELDRSAEKRVRAEKRHVAFLIAHIAEMSRRKGHLERGYKNLLEYDPATPQRIVETPPGSGAH